MRMAALAFLLTAPALGACGTASANGKTPIVVANNIPSGKLNDFAPALDDAQAAKNSLISGVTLTGIGLAGIGMGGFFIGFGGGACHNQQDCNAQVALPILGALWMAGSVLPLILGARFFMPSDEAPSASPESTPNSGKKSNRFYKNPLRIGPGGAIIQF